MEGWFWAVWDLCLHSPPCTHPGTGRQQAKKDAWSTCPGASLPTALPSAPPHPNPQFIPHTLCSLHYILWLPKPALRPWTFLPQLSHVQKSHKSAVDPGTEDDAAWLGQPGNQCTRRARLWRATASHCPALRDRQCPWGFPFKGGTDYWDPEGHEPHPEAVEVHLGESVLISKMTAKSNKQNYPLRQSREGPNDCRVSRKRWSPMKWPWHGGSRSRDHQGNSSRNTERTGAVCRPQMLFRHRRPTFPAVPLMGGRPGYHTMFRASLASSQEICQQPGPGSRACDWCSHMEPHLQKAPVLDLMLCCCCLESLNNHINELEFYKWSWMGWWNTDLPRGDPCNISFSATPYTCLCSFSDAPWAQNYNGSWNVFPGGISGKEPTY